MKLRFSFFAITALAASALFADEAPADAPQQAAENPDAAGVPVDDVAQYIQGIFRPEVDLPQNGGEPGMVAVDIG
jgi:hypothetical protein